MTTMVDGAGRLNPGDYEQVPAPRFAHVSGDGHAAVDEQGRIWNHVTITPEEGARFSAWLHEDIPCLVVKK